MKKYLADCLIKNLLDFFCKYKWLLFFFLPFLFMQVFFIMLPQWDTTAYIFGGKWFCGEQIYFEFIRPPLPAFLNCLSGAGEYSMALTTVFACVIYFAAIVLIFSKHKDKLNQFVFALFAFLFPTILFYSNYGADLLALAFLLLAFAVAGPAKKGFFFGLAALSRYNFFLFIVVLLFELRKKPRQLPEFFLPLILLWIPWIVYNYLFTGNPFFSVYESSFLNVLVKGIIAPFLIEQIMVVALFFVVLFLFEFREKISKGLNQAAVINIIMFAFSGIKEMRFLNVVAPAIAFNSAVLAKKSKTAFVVLVVLLFAVLVFAGNAFFSSLPFSTLAIPGDDFINNCRVASDKWVFFYPAGVVAEVSFDIRDWNAFVLGGGSFVLYDYKNYDLNSFGSNVIYRDGYVLIKSDSCALQPKKYISGSLRSYVLKWLRDTNSHIYDYSDWVE